MGATSLYLFDKIPHQEFIYAWYTWWSGDLIGILTLAPLILELHHRGRVFSPSKNLLPKAIACVVALALLTLVFRFNWNQAWAWALTPLILISGMYLGDLFARTLLLLIALTGVTLTAFGQLPLEFGELNSNLIYLQALLASYAFAAVFARPLRANFEVSGRRFLGPALGWLTVFAAVYVMSDIEERHLEKDYEQVVTDALDEIREATEKYQFVLGAAGSYVRQSPGLTARDWKDYYDSLGLVRGHEGILGLGVIKEVPNEQVATYLAREKIKLITIDPTYAAEQANRFVITYIEPMDRNYPAVGLDIGSEKERRTAAQKARALRRPVATHLIHLIQDFEKRHGVLLLNPIWNSDSQFMGWTYAPVITQDYFAVALNQFSPQVEMTVTLDGKTLYHNQPKSPRLRKDIHTRHHRIELFEQTFLVSFYPTNAFFKRHFGGTPPLALLMNLFMLFISGLILEQLSFGSRTEELVRLRSRELESSKLQLIQSSKLAALGKMASGVAHEINNPLTIITMKVQVLTVMLEELKVNHPPLHEEVRKISTTVQRLGNIVKGLKTYSRLSQDDPYAWTPLKQVIQETLDLSIERMNNAIDAVEASPEKWIEFSFAVEKKRVRISLRDSGPGIPEATAAKIMEPFFTTKPFGKGTGLGLSIARDIVEDHGGVIWLNRTDTHTCFVLELPTQDGAV